MVSSLPFCVIKKKLGPQFGIWDNVPSLPMLLTCGLNFIDVL